MNEDNFSRLPPAAQAYIRELETRNRQLGERITQLEKQFRLAQSKRFAPSSEKLKDCVFDEAEQIAGSESDDMVAGVTDDPFVLPDKGLPDSPPPTRSKPRRKPLPVHLPRQRIEYDLPESEKVCSCCAHALHRMGEELSEQLHIEVKASVLQHVRFKYACRHCERYAERTPVITSTDCISVNATSQDAMVAGP
jgi:transposase